MSQRSPFLRNPAPASIDLKQLPAAAFDGRASSRAALWDKAGIGISAACMMHCTALPILVAVSPSMLGGLLNDSSFHQWLLLLVLPTALIAFSLGWLRHRRWPYLLPGLLGLALVLTAALLGHDMIGEWGEKLLTFCGGLALVLGHMMNLRRGKRAR